MTAVVITAAGRSLRMGGEKKEYLPLGNGTVLSETAKKFLTAIDVAQMVVTFAEVSDTTTRTSFFADKEIEQLAKKTNLIFVRGSDTRQNSVHAALEALAKETEKPEIVLVHDGARPFVSSKIICDVVEATKKFGAAVPAITPTDTLKEKNNDFFISRHLERAQIAAVQTPQGFCFTELLEAHRKAGSDGKTYTDDSEIWGQYCGDVKIIAGDISNKKITYAGDMPAAAPSFRTGFGYDLHRLVIGRKLIIGGVEIPFEKGEYGHSDGDVLLHAVTDALLGAAAIGDIGSFFPPEDDKWKGANSVQLLQTAWQKIKADGWTLGNLDCVVKLEKPKLLPIREQIRASIATALDVPTEKIFIKAKTAEKLGDVGSGEAIEAWASCLLIK